MLSFELKRTEAGESPSELEVFLDKEGLETLISQLLFLQDGKSDHVHLMSESWGSSELCEETQDRHNVPIHHVKILLRQT